MIDLQSADTPIEKKFNRGLASKGLKDAANNLCEADISSLSGMRKNLRDVLDEIVVVNENSTPALADLYGRARKSFALGMSMFEGILNYGSYISADNSVKCFLNYAKLKELLLLSDEDKAIHNAMGGPSDCLEFVRKSLARCLLREATGVWDENLVCTSISFTDLVMVCITPESDSSTHYWAKVDPIWKELGLVSRDEFFLISFSLGLIEFLHFHSIHGRPMPVLTFGDKSARFFFGYVGDRTTDIVKLCGHVAHPQHFMLDGNQLNSDEKHDRENAALSRFARNVRELMERGVKSDFVTRFTWKWGQKKEMTREERIEKHRLMYETRLASLVNARKAKADARQAVLSGAASDAAILKVHEEFEAKLAEAMQVYADGAILSEEEQCDLYQKVEHLERT